MGAREGIGHIHECTPVIGVFMRKGTLNYSTGDTLLILLLLLLFLLLSSSSSSSSSQVHLSQQFNSSNETYYDVECERHILTTFIIPDILLISAFVYGLYIFRWVQTEQLSTLTEAVSALIHEMLSLILSLHTSVVVMLILFF